MRTFLKEIQQTTKSALIQEKSKQESIRKSQERREAAERKRIIEKDVPFRLAEAKKEIRVAAAKGAKSLMGFEGSNSLELEHVREALIKEGFTVSNPRYDSWDEDLGDFNAPCKIHVTSHSINISW